MTPNSNSKPWRGRELFERAGWQWSLAQADLDAVHAGEGLSDATAEALRGELEHGTGAVLLERLPVEGWDQATREKAFWALTSSLGTPVSQSAEGQRLFPVRDAGYAPNDPRFRGPMSSKRLSFHTDRCDVIAFLCIQPAAEGGETFVANSMALYEELTQHDPETLDVLRRPFPYLRHTVDQGNQRPYCELPVFSERDGRVGAHFLRVLIDRADRSDQAPNLTDEQRKALDALEALAENSAMHASFSLKAGDVLLLNNWTTFHRRSEFVDAEEPERKRHLLRVWLSMPNSRPIDPRFADHFGATEAGALRGGMRPLDP
ncbi:MAG: TauD/TfdA family dioxygenase [Bryobacterales bacterium]